MLGVVSRIVCVLVSTEIDLTRQQLFLKGRSFRNISCISFFRYKSRLVRVLLVCKLTDSFIIMLRKTYLDAGQLIHAAFSVDLCLIDRLLSH